MLHVVLHVCCMCVACELHVSCMAEAGNCWFAGKFFVPRQIRPASRAHTAFVVFANNQGMFCTVASSAVGSNCKDKTRSGLGF